MKINSSDALVAYLDVLGYSEMVKSGKAANFTQAEIDSALFRWNDYLTKHKYNIGASVKDHISIQVLSDTFIIVLDQEAILRDEGADSPALRWQILMIILTLVSYLVQDCMRQIKCLFRGAIVRGKHYQEGYKNLEGSTFIFSEALCDAHRLERDIASVPRILVDKSILSTLGEKEIALLSRENRPDRELARDNDGIYYLNIYAPMAGHTALFSILGHVASIVADNLKRQSIPGIVRKYVWFANFHNRFIDNLLKSNAHPSSVPCLEEIKSKQKNVLIVIPAP
ncbi:MAG: hypothetical protein PHE80_01965 [Candidatus Omnitrophica bacterium]|nr:hypothetical protein [Candidatus Omnitrophota bacterium]MDD5736802.1 hypothetical protein [Candidatus Omnitrophota bacterium]